MECIDTVWKMLGVTKYTRKSRKKENLPLRCEPMHSEHIPDCVAVICSPVETAAAIKIHAHAAMLRVGVIYESH